MATSAPQPPSEHSALQALTVRHAQGDLLGVAPLDLGPGAPGTRALEQERSESVASPAGA